MKKRLFVKIVLFVLVFACFASFGLSMRHIEGEKTAYADDNVKTADVYLIAGQSNAAGSTRKNATPSMIEYNYTPTANVLYYGETGRSTFGMSTARRLSDFRPVQHGCGFSSEHVGFELGLAEKLNALEEYSGANKKAIIFKSAAGGTSVMPDGNYNNYGNWYPRSLWTENYYDTGFYNIVGLQYRAFMDTFKSFLADAKAQGFEKIQLKGLFWMQGETDRGKPDEYLQVCSALFTDMRSDISDLTGEDYSALPIFIGEISGTFGSADEASARTNENFIRYQHILSGMLPNVYVAEIGHYDINRLEGGVSTIVGSDSAHWNYEDVVNIGRDFAAKYFAIKDKEMHFVYIDIDKSTSVGVAASKAVHVEFTGELGPNFRIGDKVEFEVELTVNYGLESVSADGATVNPVEKYFADNSLSPVYKYEITDMTDDVRLSIVYKSNKAYRVNVTCSDETYGRAPSPKNIANAYSGNKYTFNVDPKYNGAVEKFIINGVEVPGIIDVTTYVLEDWEEKFNLAENKTMNIEIVYGEYETVKELLSSTPDDTKPGDGENKDPEDDKPGQEADGSSGCGGSCSGKIGIAEFMWALSALGVALLIVRKRG